MQRQFAQNGRAEKIEWWSEGQFTQKHWDAKSRACLRTAQFHPNPFPFAPFQSYLRLFRITPLLIERLREAQRNTFHTSFHPSFQGDSEPGFLLYWNRYHEMLSHTGMFLLFPPINDPSTTSYFIAQNRSHSAKPYRLLSMDFLCTDSEHVSPIAFPYVLLFTQRV